MRYSLPVLAMAATLMAAGPAAATTNHEIMMLNRGADGQTMVYEPAFLKIQPGDTVTFVPTDRTHNAEIIANMVPEGGGTFKGRINEEITFAPAEPGFYGIKCLPHYAMGMVALIQVGDEPANLEEAEAVRHPGLARARMAALFEQVRTEADTQ